MEYILGIIVSLVAQVWKRYLGTDTLGTYVGVFAMSILGAGFYVLAKDTALWGTLVQVLIAAGAFHNFILRRFE